MSGHNSKAKTPSATATDSQREAFERGYAAALRESLKFAIHKGRCAAFPASSEQQIYSYCNCGLVELFGELAKPKPIVPLGTKAASTEVGND